ncbi:MAG: hypothetical protein Q9218_008180 [Villophora microphyllina]
MKLPPHVLEEEGFFDEIVNTVIKIAPTVVTIAPSVISNLVPAVGNIIKAATGQEAAFAGSPAQPSSGRKVLAAKRSASRLRNTAAGGNDFLAKVGEWQSNKGN